METDKFELTFAKVIKGQLLNYLKDIPLCGRIDRDSDFIIWGCRVDDEKKFYKGVLEFDKSVVVHGFKTVEEVEEYWMVGDMNLYIDKGDYEIVENKFIEI